MRLRALILFAALACLVPAVAAAEDPVTTVSTASFSGDGIAFVFTGTFVLDHFDVAAPTPDAADVLVAAGTASGTVTTFAGVSSPFAGPFTWVKVSVSGSCDGIHVTLGRLVYSDFRGLHGEIYFAGLPIAPWATESARWGLEGDTGLDITGSSGLLCAVAKLSGTSAPPKALATVLNQLLRS